MGENKSKVLVRRMWSSEKLEVSRMLGVGLGHKAEDHFYHVRKANQVSLL